MERRQLQCWECQVNTDAPIIVTLRTPDREIGRYPLCPACYRAYFLPLAPDGSRMLVLILGDGNGKQAL
jgi:hypothetical protein